MKPQKPSRKGGRSGRSGAAGSLRVSTCVMGAAALALAHFSLSGRLGLVSRLASNEDLRSAPQHHNLANLQPPQPPQPLNSLSGGGMVDAAAQLRRLELLRSEVEAKTREMSELMARIGRKPEPLSAEAMPPAPQLASPMESSFVSPQAAVLVPHPPPPEPQPMPPREEPRPQAHEVLAARISAAAAASEHSPAAPRQALSGDASAPVYSPARNPILFMSEEVFRSTPLNEMLDMYGPKAQRRQRQSQSQLQRRRRLAGRRSGGGGGGGGGGGCDYDFGVELSDRWRKSATECCHPRSDGGGGGGGNGTSLTCHFIQQTRHSGPGDQLLHGRNVRLNFRDLVADNGKIPKAYYKRYVDTKHNQGHSKIKWSKGTLAGTCAPDPASGWKGENFPGWNRDFFDAFEPLEPVQLQSHDRGSGLQCDVWVDAPTLVRQAGAGTQVFFLSSSSFLFFFSFSSSSSYSFLRRSSTGTSL